MTEITAKEAVRTEINERNAELSALEDISESETGNKIPLQAEKLDLEELDAASIAETIETEDEFNNKK